jgi:hypothetical protein
VGRIVATFHNWPFHSHCRNYHEVRCLLRYRQEESARSRIMYIESKAESLQSPARIGRVTFTKSGKGIYYRGREFYRISGFKANYAEVEIHNPYWISGPRRDGRDRLYTHSGLPIEIDDDVREEYWREIRKRPDCVTRTMT